MHFQEIRRAAAQGTISLPPPMDSEGLEDLAVLKSCLKVIRELSGFRYAFAKDAMAETFAPLMASVEAKNELERQGLKVSLKSYFLSLILKDLENPDIVTIDNYINALFNCADAAANGPITVQTVVNVANSFPQDGINWRQNPQTEEEQILLQPDTFPDSKAVQVELARWEKYSKELRDLDPLVHALLTNLYFMAISPLNRHNGRVTQILLQLSLMGQNINSPAPCLMLGRALMTSALRHRRTFIRFENPTMVSVPSVHAEDIIQSNSAFRRPFGFLTAFVRSDRGLLEDDRFSLSCSIPAGDIQTSGVPYG